MVVSYKLNQESLESLVSRTSEKANVHGLVFHIESEDNSISLTSSAGNMTNDSQYYIASINKLMISFITLRLCQEKKLNLNDKIAGYLPKDTLEGLLIYNGKDYTDSITIKQLISHTSGLPCYLLDKRPDGKHNMKLILNGNDQSWPFTKVVEEVKKMKPAFTPGTKGKANYSETNFRIMDQILKVATGENIEVLLTSVFRELKMNNTFVVHPGSALSCVPVFFKKNQISLSKYWESTHHDIVSTAVDQMKFIKAFFNGEYIPAAQIDDLKKWNNIFFPFRYGIGIQEFYIPRMFSPFKAVPEMIGHGGSVGSVAFYIPEKKAYITGTINQTSSPDIAYQFIVKVIMKL